MISENSIKLLLLIFIIITMFIPSIFKNNMIILWERIYYLNYFKAVLAIISYAFLPGANIYNIIFPHDVLSNKLKIEPVIVKLTLYPLLSLCTLGISVLLFDQLGSTGGQMEILIFLFISILFILDFILQIKRHKSLDLSLIEIKISKNSIIIILLAVGISTISIGFQLGWSYLVSGDPWASIKYANLIGDPKINPIFIDDYPNFWGYISYGLSIVSGFPFININSLLAPFNYLFIFSVFIFMKSLLLNYHIKYSVLSTILISLFSGFFIEPLISSIVFVGDFYFIYKSFAYILFFISLGLFFITSTNNFNYAKEIRLLILSAFFFIISFMTYIFPLIFGILILFIYCLLTKKIEKSTYLKFFLYLLILILILYILFDLILNNYLSQVVIYRFLLFFDLNIIEIENILISPPILIYLFFIFFILIVIIIRKYLKRTGEITLKKKWNPFLNKIFIIFLTLFIIFLIIEFLSLLIEFLFLQIDLSEHFFFYIFLDKIILNIGLIGIMGIVLSFYSFKQNKKLSIFFFIWIFITFIFAFLSFFAEIIINNPLSPQEISEWHRILIGYWFNRIWFYSIPPLCIFGSIGIFVLLERLQKIHFIYKLKSSHLILKNLIATTIICFSFSGVIITGVIYGNSNFRYTDNQITTLEWVSENVPIHSGVLVGDNFFMGVGIKTITFVNQYFMYDIFEVDFNETQCIQQIEYLKNETIQYAVLSQFFISYYLNKTDFTNNILIPQFYNVSLYHYGDLSVYYAPFFD